MSRSRTSGWLVAIGLSALGCTGSPSSGATAQSACANLGHIAPCGDWSMDETACESGLSGYQMQAEQRACVSQYGALVTCLDGLTACPPGSGTLCPTEYSALGACVATP